MSSTHLLNLFALFMLSMDDDAIVWADGQDGKFCNPWGSEVTASSESFRRAVGQIALHGLQQIANLFWEDKFSCAE